MSAAANSTPTTTIRNATSASASTPRTCAWLVPRPFGPIPNPSAPNARTVLHLDLRHLPTGWPTLPVLQKGQIRARPPFLGSILYDCFSELHQPALPSVLRKLAPGHTGRSNRPRGGQAVARPFFSRANQIVVPKNMERAPAQHCLICHLSLRSGCRLAKGCRARRGSGIDECNLCIEDVCETYLDRIGSQSRMVPSDLWDFVRQLHGTR